MALFDIFKNKKGEGRFEKKQREKTEAKRIEEKEKKKGTTSNFAAPASPAKLGGQASKILVEPHITEKATSVSDQNAYVFKVRPDANKHTVKQAVKEAYGVAPEKVNISRSKPKARFVRGKFGEKKGFKKATVYLKEGDKIELA